MSNDLKLSHTLIELGNDGMLSLYQNRRSARLTEEEVDMLAGWLALTPPAHLDTVNNSFKRDKIELIINNHIFIPDHEVEVLRIWLLSL